MRARRRSGVARCTDPYSGQPEAKATPAAIAPVDIRDARLRPHASGRSPCRTAPGGHASRPPTAPSTGSPTDHGPMIWHDFALSRMLAGDAKLAEHLDGGPIAPPPSSTATVDGCHLRRTGRTPPRETASASPALDIARRRRARSRGSRRCPRSRPSPVVCACFGVGVDTRPRRHRVRRGAHRRRDRHRRRAPAPIAARACPNSNG